MRPHIDRHWRQPGYEAPDCRVHARLRGFFVHYSTPPHPFRLSPSPSRLYTSIITLRLQLAYWFFLRMAAMTTSIPSPSTLSGTLYQPRFEHDACGIGLIADIPGRRTHEIVSLAVEALANLEHRGGVAADAGTGDGAGLPPQDARQVFPSGRGRGGGGGGGARRRPRRRPGPRAGGAPRRAPRHRRPDP